MMVWRSPLQSLAFSGSPRTILTPLLRNKIIISSAGKPSRLRWHILTMRQDVPLAAEIELKITLFYDQLFEKIFYIHSCMLWPMLFMFVVLEILIVSTPPIILSVSTGRRTVPRFSLHCLTRVSAWFQVPTHTNPWL